MSAPTYSWEKLHVPLFPQHHGLWLITTRFNYTYLAVQDDFGNLVYVPA